jgi:hypothetical protein
MKTLKMVGIPVLVLATIAIALAYFLLSNLDEIIKRVIEEVGSQVTRTEVTLESVHLDLKTGRGKLSGLKIANPPGGGYKSAYAFQLDSILLDVDLESLNGPVVIITDLTVDGAKLIAEQKGEKTNLSELLDKVRDSSEKAGKASTGKKQTQPQGEAASSDVRLMLEKFTFTNTSATIITEQLGEKALQVPGFQLNNIGNKEAGLTPEQAAIELLRGVIKETTLAVRDQLRELAEDALEEKYQPKKKLREKLKSLFKRGD